MDEISQALKPESFTPRKTVRLRERSPSRVWPLAAINGRAPVILETGGDARGVELAYARLHSADSIESSPPGTPHGTDTHFTPAMTPALSIDDGVIMYAGRHGYGFGIIVNHLNGWASHYSNLSALCAVRTDLHQPREQRVRAGDVIGYVGAPSAGAFKRLYFELWESNHAHHFVPLDPRDQLQSWKLAHHIDHATPIVPEAA